MKQTLASLIIGALSIVACSKNETHVAYNLLADSMKMAVKGWVEVVNTRNYDDLSKYVANDVIDHSSLTDRKGTLEKNYIAGFKEFAIAMRDEYPEYKIQIEDMIADGNIIAIRMYETGKRSIDSAGVKILTPVQKASTIWLRWENGKFVEYWDQRESKHMKFM